jgi:hypothetical protein
MPLLTVQNLVALTDCASVVHLVALLACNVVYMQAQLKKHSRHDDHMQKVLLTPY